MINNITPHGSSFKGLMAYLLHDKDMAPTSERVAWTETRNLAADDPEKAWRIMLATAKTQAELKAEAGIKNTGRKSHKHVFHYSLSWSGEEDRGITKEEMIAAAEASMTYLGVYEGERLGTNKKTGKPIIAKRTQHADEHQAIIVCHDDTKNPHVHIVMNRVHAGHGVMLPDNYEREKLSAWALDYRRAQGKEHLCEQRVINAAMKAQGIVTNNPRKPRNVYEQEQAIKDAEPGSRKKALLESQEKRRKELATKTAAMKKHQAEQMHALEAGHVKAERAVRARSAEIIKKRVSMIREAYAPRVAELSERQAGERAAFNQAKGTAAGHVRNTWAAFKTKQWMTEIRTSPLDAMKHSFTLAFSSGLQARDIEKHHARETSQLRGERVGQERTAAREVRTDEGFKLDELRQKYHEARNDLILEQGMDQAKLKAEWRQLDRDHLATEAEDERKHKSKASPGGDGRGPEAGQQEKRQQGGGIDIETDLAEQVEGGAEPIPHEVPDEYLRKIAADLKASREAEAQREQGTEQEPERGD